MLSNLELRHLVESGFLPVKCHCTINDVGVMSIQLINPITHGVDLTVPGIRTSDLSSSRTIAGLVAQIKEEYRLAHERYEVRKFSS